MKFVVTRFKPLFETQIIEAENLEKAQRIVMKMCNEPLQKICDKTFFRIELVE